jgi:alkaline phosphatase
VLSEFRSKKLITTAKKMLGKKAGIDWTTSQHTGTPVPVSAIGTGSKIFDGYYDNTEIPKKIAEIMGLKGF